MRKENEIKKNNAVRERERRRRNPWQGDEKDADDDEKYEKSLRGNRVNRRLHELCHVTKKSVAAAQRTTFDTRAKLNSWGPALKTIT